MAIISSDIFLVLPLYSFRDSEYMYIRLLGVTSQLIDAALIFFKSFITEISRLVPRDQLSDEKGKVSREARMGCPFCACLPHAPGWWWIATTDSPSLQCSYFDGSDRTVSWFSSLFLTSDISVFDAGSSTLAQQESSSLLFTSLMELTGKYKPSLGSI